ncbi:MAG TPA: tetratricopeptide repeat protein, partial [Pyrinomonadaceae bacterium]|nr:tetratricopeptide repeat protein [Pyrinomonadaceae bacterium]
ASSTRFAVGSDVRAHARRGRALRGVVVAALAAAALVALPQVARAQIDGARAPAGGSGGQHEIYGEFKVDESKAKEKVPGSFVLVLMTDAGKVVERQSAMHNARFRFFGLRNGNYEIVVESAGMPVGRLSVQLISSRKVELKQDITLEWDAASAAKAASKAGTVSAADYYERPAANRDLFEKASGAIKKKKYEDAAALLQQIVSADEKDHIAWTYLASAHNALGKAADSERCYVRALALRPDLLAAAVNLGRLYVIGKNFNKAVEVLKPAVEKHPQSSDAHFLLGEAELQTGQYDDAATELREALRLDPKGKAEAHLRLAMLLNAAGKKDKAAAELEQFIAKQPEHPNREKFEEYIRQNKKH